MHFLLLHVSCCSGIGLGAALRLGGSAILAIGVEPKMYTDEATCVTATAETYQTASRARSSFFHRWLSRPILSRAATPNVAKHVWRPTGCG